MMNKVLNILEQTEGLGKEEFSRLKTYLLKLRKEGKHESRTNNTRKRIQRLNKRHKS